MFQDLQAFEKNIRTSCKSKKMISEQTAYNDEGQLGNAAIVNEKPVAQQAATKDALNISMNESNEVEDSDKKKRKKTKIRNVTEANSHVSLNGNDESPITPLDHSENSVESKKKKKKKRRNSLGESKIVTLSGNDETSIAPLDDCETSVEVKKKKKKKKDKKTEPVDEVTVPSNGNPEMSNLKCRKIKKRSHVPSEPSETDAVTDLDIDSETGQVKMKKRKVDPVDKNFQVDVSQESTLKNSGDGIPQNNEQLTSKRKANANTKVMVHDEQSASVSFSKQDVKKNEKKSVEAARKQQMKKSAAGIVNQLQTRGKGTIIIDSASDDYGESASSDEAPRKRSKKQLESDVSVLRFENRNLKSQLSVYRNSEKAAEASKTLMENLKECQRYLKKMKFSCPNCNCTDALKDVPEFQKLLSFNQSHPTPALPSSQILGKSFSEKVTLPSLIKTSGNSVSKPAEITPKVFLSTDTAEEAEDLERIDPITPDPLSDSKNDFESKNESETNIEKVVATKSPSVEKTDVPVTDIGQSVKIPTSVLEKFRKGNLRHYLLDMANTVYSPVEFATCSKSGKKKGSTEKKVLDPLKKQAIIDYTEQIFTASSKAEIEKQLTDILTNKCKNAKPLMNAASVNAEIKT